MNLRSRKSQRFSFESKEIKKVNVLVQRLSGRKKSPCSGEINLLFYLGVKVNSSSILSRSPESFIREQVFGKKELSLAYVHKGSS